MKTILLVEDSPDLAAVIRRELEATGYAVLHTTDGLTALKPSKSSMKLTLNGSFSTWKANFAEPAPPLRPDRASFLPLFFHLIRPNRGQIIWPVTTCLD